MEAKNTIAINIVPITGLEEIAPIIRAGAKFPALIILVVLLRLVVRSINLVDWNNLSGLADLNADELTVDTDKLFPAIGATIASIDCSCAIVDEEDSKMSATFPRSCKGSVVSREIDDVVNLNVIHLDRAHGTPPSTVFVAMRTPAFCLEPS